MPAISKIRLTNVVYEEGNKRYNDEIFLFDGNNGAILLENGGGKTVFIQTVLQAMIPHTDLAERRIKNTLVLENAPAHIAVEWIINENPRRYLLTAVTLFMTKDGLDSLRYVYEYSTGDAHGIEHIPFVIKERNRPAEKGEIEDYYKGMKERNMLARTFSTIKEYRHFLEEEYLIIGNEWDSIAKINSTEGGVEAFFDNCKNTNQLFDRLLIPVVENSIAGHNPKLFADMFEQQHENLKEYKKLKEKIEENKKIHAELENYVTAFEKLHKAEEQYTATKQIAKGIWEELHGQKQQKNEEHDKIFTQIEQWKSNWSLHKLKEASYEIAIENEKYEALKKEYELVLAEHAEKDEKLREATYRYFSLKYAQLKEELKKFHDELLFIEDEIKKLDETEELADLENELDERKGELLGYFLKFMEQIKKEIDGIQYELNPLQHEIGKLNQQISATMKEEREKENALTALQTQINTRLQDIARLKQFLLANPEQQSVEEEYDTWEKRSLFLDEEIIRLKTEINSLIKKQKEMTVELKHSLEEKQLKEREQERLENALTNINEEEKRLLNQLTALRPQWSTIESIYEKEATIHDYLNEQLHTLNQQKSDLLYKERLAYRLVDDYGKQTNFFSEPYIESQLHAWKNQFDYCISGIEYLQSLPEEELEKKLQYPLWSLTLITTSRSKENLIAKIQGASAHLYSPIRVLSMEEAAAIDEYTNDHDWIMPRHWENGYDSIAFDEWKQEIETKAKEATARRNAKEIEIRKWEQGLDALRLFLDKYPFTKKQSLQEQSTELLLEIESLSRKITANEEEIQSIGQQISQRQTKISEYKDEKDHLDRKLEKALEYFQYVREKESNVKSETRLKEDLSRLKGKLNSWNKELDELANTESFLTERMTELKLRLRLHENSDEYQAVQGYRPIFSERDKSVITDEINSIELKLKNIHTSYGELKARLDYASKNIDAKNKQIETLLNEQGSLDEQLLFPTDGEHQLEQLLLQKKKLKAELRLLNKKVGEKSRAKDKQEGKRDSLVNQFSAEEQIYTFTVPLEEAKAQLKQEKLSLQERKKYLESELTSIQKEQQLIENAEREMEKYIVVHHFNVPMIDPIPLTNEQKLEFMYNRYSFTKNILQILEEKKNIVEIEKQKVDKRRHEFREFCLTITDIRLRKMAENGVEYKKTYDELLDFRKNMLKRIETATNYANESIREKDSEFQKFVSLIHNHLKTIVDGLKEIPNKTKIRVGNKWKTIYHFTIPDWHEEEGKQRIREHIEWILGQLESDLYKHPDGSVDETKVRKDIEMWLQSKQLLHIVIDKEGMKVNCRKVTNENNVTSRSYSWEQSNIWSGGEKWSKNMTLFLGILNYVAEKKKQYKPQSKRHRAVILDNPFGKASSDHVLNPVFFIAEQLGFQIIALTAHAEGKFLQDYFPVIYSCRLRESTDPNKQIVTTEKWLHHAYFRDHDPISLERLGETEQLSLLDL